MDHSFYWEYHVWIHSPPQSIQERRLNFLKYWMQEAEGAELEEAAIAIAIAAAADDQQGGDIDNKYSGRAPSTQSQSQSQSQSHNSHKYSSTLTTLLLTSSSLQSCNTSTNTTNDNVIVDHHHHHHHHHFQLHLINNATKCRFRNNIGRFSFSFNFHFNFNRLRSIVCCVGGGIAMDQYHFPTQTIPTTPQPQISFKQLFTGQHFQAHHGPITLIKFSHDGCYLATAGHHNILKVWQVVEHDILESDDDDDDGVLHDIPHARYFPINHLHPTLHKLNVTTTKHPANNCIVLPSKVFRILENPLHVFQGHTDEILDLAWSKKNNCLLSSSVDKTVRLWQVGVNQQLKVFPHNDYVTCIEFNPTSDDDFISGSIDGKVRIWNISGGKVVKWNETRDIITAIAYHPNAQGGIVGSIHGTCCYFTLSDNHLQLGSQMSLSTKKSSCKRITGFQFLPQDPSKVLVTCADSNVRIIDGGSVITKYKGWFGVNEKHTSASLTPDGKHIVSASDNSNVYVWKYNGDEYRECRTSQPKVNRSFECFRSDGAALAIPWPGFKSDSLLPRLLCPTWPEEELPKSSPIKPWPCSCEYKLIAIDDEGATSTWSWGMVIVSAGWDGRIQTFHSYGLPVSRMGRLE